jgi:hypothetical protein
LSIIPSNSDFKKEIEDEIINGLISDINIRIKKFDNIYNTNKIEKSLILAIDTKKKNAVLTAGKTLVDDTRKYYKQLLDYIKPDNYQFENIIDQVFTRANASIITPFNTEMSYLNDATPLGGIDYGKLQFDIYETNIKHFKAHVAPYDLDIKKTINENHKGIKKICADIREVKNRSSSSRSSYSSGSSYSSNNYDSDNTAIIYFVLAVILLVVFLAMSNS